MQQNMSLMKNKIKENIKLLIETGSLEEAKILIEEYKKYILMMWKYIPFDYDMTRLFYEKIVIFK